MKARRLVENYSVPLRDLPHILEQFCHADDAVRDGINLGLRDALEIRLLPFSQGHEFSPEFEHEPILRRGGSRMRVGQARIGRFPY